MAVLTATARDADGIPIFGRVCVFSITGSNNALSAASAPTGVDGIASVTLSSTKAEAKIVSVVVGGVDLPTRSTVTFAPGPAATLAFSLQPTHQVAGTIISPAVQVAVSDSHGNLVSGGTETVTLSLSGGAAGAALLGTSSIALVSGIADFSNLSVRVAGNGYALAATAAGLSGATSATFDVSAAAPDPSASSVTAAPASLAAGAATTLTASVRDAFGNPVQNEAITFGATGNNNNVINPSTGTGATGMASGTFSSTRAETKLVTGYLSDARALAGMASVVFNAASPAAGATASTLVPTPASVTDDGTPIALAATVRDQFGNPVAGASVVFASSGTATFIQPIASSDASGVAVGSVSSVVAGVETITAKVGAISLATADVTFMPTYSLGGTVTGLTTSGLVLGSLGLIELPVPKGSISFAFPAKMSPGAAYDVTVVSQPTGQRCGVSQGAGTIANSNVTNIAVTCTNVWKQVVASDTYTTALRADGTIWAWGLNNWGQLGDGTTTQRTRPVQVGTDADWKSISADTYATLAIKIDGTLWSWGSNAGCGLLGTGTTAEQHSPTQIGTDANWAVVAVGFAHSMAIRTDGTLWAFGANNNGQLGDGTLVNRSTPVQVGADTNWAAASGGSWYTLGLKTDGTLWAWGSAYSGNLGYGGNLGYLFPVGWDYRNFTSPVQVGTEVVWSSVAARGATSMAKKANGTLWMWGSNDYGQLGDGTTTQRNAPVQVGTDRNWAAVGAGGGPTLATKTDGTLWAWGWNSYGQLGNGTTVSVLSPIQIGVDTRWATVSTSGFHTAAIMADGTLWVWGRNDAGQLGDGTVTQRESPIQVGP